MFDIFKNTFGGGGSAPAAHVAGQLKLHFTPANPQLGQVAMSRSVSKEQWDAIVAILDNRSL